MVKLHQTHLLVDHFNALIVSEIITLATKKRFNHPEISLPNFGEVIVDSDGQEWKFHKVEVPNKGDVFWWSDWDGKCYLLMATEKPMMSSIFCNNIFTIK